MTFRDDHAAALARIEALERQLADERRRAQEERGRVDEALARMTDGQKAKVVVTKVLRGQLADEQRRADDERRRADEAVARVAVLEQEPDRLAEELRRQAATPPGSPVPAPPAAAAADRHSGDEITRTALVIALVVLGFIGLALWHSCEADAASAPSAGAAGDDVRCTDLAVTDDGHVAACMDGGTTRVRIDQIQPSTGPSTWGRASCSALVARRHALLLLGVLDGEEPD